MEVHPPHEPVHSWREALIHIGLMTVGLFIALMLEGVVEYLHHKELVHQARENIRHELEGNQKAAQQNLTYLKENQAAVNSGLDTLHFMQTHTDAHGQHINFGMVNNSLGDSAWRTARDTGALGFMPYDEVQRYADVYGLQQSISTEADRIVRQEAETLAPLYAAGADFTRISPAQYQQMEDGAAKSYLDLEILSQFTKGLVQSYNDALKPS